MPKSTLRWGLPSGVYWLKNINWQTTMAMEERLSIPPQPRVWRCWILQKPLHRNTDGHTDTQTHSPSPVQGGSSGISSLSSALKCPQHFSFIRACQKPQGIKPAGGVPCAEGVFLLCRLPKRARKWNRQVKPVPVPLHWCKTLYVLQTTKGQT